MTNASDRTAIDWRDPATWLWLFGLAAVLVVATVCPTIASGLIVEHVSGPWSDIDPLWATAGLALSLWLLIFVPLYLVFEKRLNIDAPAAASEQRKDVDFAVLCVLSTLVMIPCGFMIYAIWSWLDIEGPVTVAWAGISAGSVATFSLRSSLYLRRRSAAQTSLDEKES